MKRSHFAAALVATTIAALAACGSEPPPSGELGAAGGVAAVASDATAAQSVSGGDGEVGVSVQALAGWPALKANWQQTSSQPTKLATTADHICVLTRVTGRFRGAGEVVRLATKLYNGVEHWILTGASQQTQVAGTAMCFRKSDFIGAGAAVISHKLHGTRPVALNDDLFCESTTFTSSNAGWSEARGRAFTMLSGVEGGLFGWSNVVRTEQGTTGDATNRAMAQVCETDGGTTTMAAWASTFFVPRTGNQPVLFKGPGGVVGTAAETDPFHRLISTPAYGLVLPVAGDEAMCAFTHIEGRFSGGGEFVALSINSDNKWMFEASAQSTGIQAEVRCMLRDQRQACTAAESGACAVYGCGCVDHTCSGGNCAGSGCTSDRVSACAAFGCGCSVNTCSGGACP